MFGVPLHPMVVHFPVVLSIVLPISVLVAIWAIRKGTTPRRAWAVPLAFAAVMALSAFVATRTGEADEERVERVVSEGAIHEHEEAGERFFLLSGVLLLVAAGGLMRNTFGNAARLVTAVGAIGMIVAGIQVGHSGGTLVYRHNAASAHATAQDVAGGGLTEEAGGDVTPAGTQRNAEDSDR